MPEQTENIYHIIREKLKGSSAGVVLTTLFPSGNSGNIAEWSRTLEPGGVLDAGMTDEILLSGKPALFYRGTEFIYAEPFLKQERMLIFGGGHIALPLTELAKMTGFYVAVADDREEFASEGRFPQADEVLCGSFAACIAELKPAPGDYCVIITRGHSQDTQCIRELFRYEETVYTGMIGSRKRTGAVFSALAEEGLDRERLGRIRTPIGLPIGAKTVEEIAVSILAEVIKRKRLESVGHAAVDRSDSDRHVLECLAGMHRPCALATVMEANGSVPRAEGAKMIVYPDAAVLGSIGGGGVEAAVIQRAKELIGTGRYEILDVDLNGTDAMAEGMICGGSLKILIEDFVPEIKSLE